MTEPTVGEFMTPAPVTIGAEQSLDTAHRLMRQYEVRHLPVLHGGRLVGIVSQRDLYLIETFTDVEPTEVTVEEAMTQDPCVVQVQAPLRDVASAMASGRFGSVIVVDDGVVGIFTAIDAQRALATLLGAPAPQPTPTTATT